jgi:hypothetical protein
MYWDAESSLDWTSLINAVEQAAGFVLPVASIVIPK